MAEPDDSARTAPVQHGGDPADAQALFADAPTPWLDLSTGINPRPYPLPPFAIEAWTRLPGKVEEAALRAIAARSYRAPGPERVVPAPGTQVLIGLLGWLRPQGRVAVLSPTYAEHAVAWARAGHTVRQVAGIQDLADADVAVLTNPNNPDGRMVDRSELLRLARAKAERGGWLVVDEAFADVVDPDVSVAPDVDAGGVIVLRSFGKFFGLAGLRLGFAIAASALAGRIAGALGPWVVAGPALAAGSQALADLAWIADTRRWLAAASPRMDRLLAGAGFSVIGGTDLFRLAESANAPAWFNRLGRAGIYVRRFADRPDRLRFGLPGTEDGWTRLAAALTGRLA
ncbi:MAG: threonine-phosphate decarboxylase CobD [Rhodospirillales bacterium]|nr:threonine-phosphate decarboxylase CobD [Rhodospirillales bacterium]